MREEVIRRYILDKIKKLKKQGIYIKEEELEEEIQKYASSKDNMRDVMKMIDKDEEKFLENYKKTQELRKEYINKLEENKELEDIPLEYTGFDMDKETAEILKIEDTDDAKELKSSLIETSKQDPKVEDMHYTDKQVLKLEHEIDDIYQDNISDQN